jgi:hypothetical protein
MSNTHEIFAHAGLDEIASKHPVNCAVCDGRFTVDRLLELKLGPPITMIPVPLCPKHYFECEGGILDWRKTKSPPCIVNVQAVGPGTHLGRMA